MQLLTNFTKTFRDKIVDTAVDITPNYGGHVVAKWQWKEGVPVHVY